MWRISKQFFLINLLILSCFTFTTQLFQLQEKIIQLQTKGQFLAQQRKNAQYLSGKLESNRTYNSNNTILKITQKCRLYDSWRNSKKSRQRQDINLYCVQKWCNQVDGYQQRVFDEEGTNKLKFMIQGFDSELRLLIDHHPYPLIVTKSNWISMFQTTKYIEISQNCPHIPNIKYVLSQNYYGQTFYVITNNKIFLVGFQIGKRICNIRKQYDLMQQVNQIEKAVFYGNSIFFDDKVYNLTQRQLYYINQCNNITNQFLFKKNHQDQIFRIRNCCDSEICSVSMIQMKKISQEKTVFFWLIISFILVIFISLFFMKKAKTSNFEYIDDPSYFPQKQIQKFIKEKQQAMKQKIKRKK